MGRESAPHSPPTQIAIKITLPAEFLERQPHLDGAGVEFGKLMPHSGAIRKKQLDRGVDQDMDQTAIDPATWLAPGHGRGKEQAHKQARRQNDQTKTDGQQHPGIAFAAESGARALKWRSGKEPEWFVATGVGTHWV